MITTVEISMYPFDGNYRDLIKDFIAKLNRYRYADLRVTTHSTSTIVTGEHHRLLQILTELMEWSHERHGKSVFVTKIIPGLEP